MLPLNSDFINVNHTGESNFQLVHMSPLKTAYLYLLY